MYAFLDRPCYGKIVYTKPKQASKNLKQEQDIQQYKAKEYKTRQRHLPRFFLQKGGFC